MADQFDVEALYRALGFRVPLEGIPDNEQKCQALDCSNMAAHTSFFQHKSVPQDLRLWLCARHHELLMGPKPIAVRALCPNTHLESIPMEHRDRMKADLTAQIHGYCLEQLVQPKGEITWQWNWIDMDDGTGQGGRIQGTELMGIQQIERIELHAPTA